MNSFDHDGYIVARGLFSSAEVEHIRDTFMTQAKDGRVGGLGGFPPPGREAYDPNDPLSRYPRMMMPHQHPDKPVGELSMGLMLDPRLEPILRRAVGRGDAG